MTSWRVAVIGGAIATFAAATALSGRAHAPQGNQTTDAPATGVIAGQVVDALSGAPVPSATVTLSSSTRATKPRTSTTHSDGRFEFSELPAAKFSISVRADGYVFGYYGALHYADGAGNSLELLPAERRTTAVVRVWPQSRIRGRVTDERGEPAVNLVVRFLRREHVAGRLLWRPSRSARTDDRGHFSSLGPPGDYLVVAPAEKPVLGRPELRDRGDAVSEPVFYDAARSVSAASVISLLPGDTRADVNFTVRLTPTDRPSVSGRILFGGPRPLFAVVYLVPGDSHESVAHLEGLLVPPEDDGRFTFRNVPAGDYRLRATVFPVTPSEFAATLYGDVTRLGKPLLSPPATPTLVADLPVSVTKSIDNLEVVLQPGARIGGRVLIDGRSDMPAAHPLVGAPVFIFPAYPDSRDPGYRIPAVGLDSAGRFQTVGLPPGKYFFNSSLYVEPTSYALTSVRLDGRELLGVGVDVGTTDVSDLVLTVTNRRWALSGAVRDRSGQLVPAARVIVFPRDRSRWQVLGYFTTPSQLVTDRSGAFQTSGAISGDYLAAVATAPPEFWLAPEYLETLVPFATPVRLELGEKRSIELRLP